MTTADHGLIDNTESSPVWLARAGGRGEDEAVALELGLAIVGFTEIPDLTGVPDRDSVLEMVRRASPRAKDARNRTRAAQMNSFVLRMKKGDIVVLPLKTRQGQVAVGRIEGPYRYQPIDDVMRHTRRVNWLRPDVPRSEFGQDLLYSMGTLLTVCRIKRNDAERRVASILMRSRDLGSDTSAKVSGSPEAVEEFEEDDGKTLGVAQIARDQILEHIRSRFTGHEFAELVEAVLQAEGYFTSLSPAGPDGGVDILAGRGPLGFEGPRLCVQVKALASAVDVTVFRSLVGAMKAFGADQGLLVSWGGFTRSLEREARQSFFEVRLWHADDVVNAIFRNYDKLPEQVRTISHLRGCGLLCIVTMIYESRHPRLAHIS